jgi:hypothetical protein
MPRLVLTRRKRTRARLSKKRFFVLAPAQVVDEHENPRIGMGWEHEPQRNENEDEIKRVEEEKAKEEDEERYNQRFRATGSCFVDMQWPPREASAQEIK